MEPGFREYYEAMCRSLIAAALVIAMLEVAPLISAQDGGDRQYSVTAVKTPDVQQQTLQAFDPASQRTTEVFPGTYVSPFGALMMKRIEDMFARVGESDRATLLAANIGAGFDRSITSWRAQPNGRTVALAVHYYRDRLVAARHGIVGRLRPARAARCGRL